MSAQMASAAAALITPEVLKLAVGPEGAAWSCVRGERLLSLGTSSGHGTKLPELKKRWWAMLSDIGFDYVVLPGARSWT